MLTLKTFCVAATVQLTSGAADAATNSTFSKYEEPSSITGRIFARGSTQKSVLFNFTRQATRSGTKLLVLRQYTYPDGKLAARERLVYAGNQLLSYDLQELQTGASGRAIVRLDAKDPAKSRIWFEYSENAMANAKQKTDSELLQKDTLVNDMVGPFLQSQWDALDAGKAVKCRYIVVPRRETVGFTFKKEPESPKRSSDIIVVKMEATGPVIAALIDPLFFTIAKKPPHRVLEYVGRTTPKVKSGSKWKDLDAVTVFDWGPR